MIASKTVLLLISIMACVVVFLNGSNIIEIREDGHDIQACKNSNHDGPKPSCRTLDFVFNGGSGMKNNTLVNIYPGTYHLRNNTNFKYVSNIALVGLNVSNRPVIYCLGSDVGISFERSENLRLHGLELRNCQVNRNSSLVSALHFIYSKNINISAARFVNNQGKAISMWDIGGKIEMRSVVFENNTSIHSGGGVYIEFTKCGALDSVGCSTQPEQQNYIHNNSFIFTNCQFYSNNYDLKFFQHGRILPDFIDSKFTKGGGLTVFLWGNASSNAFHIYNCKFRNNLASWGGGMNIDMHDKTNNNIFLLDNKTDFINNSASYAGGAVNVGLLFYNRYSFRKFNKITFNNSTFLWNKAIWGGAVSVRGTTRLLKHPENQEIKSLFFKRCTFLQNYATVGSAFGLSTDNLNLNPVGTGISYGIVFDYCWISNNEIIWTEDDRVIGQGALYAEESMMFFRETHFYTNDGTAVVLDSSSFSVSGNVTFQGNTGLKGGAMALYGNSWVLLRNGSTLVFKRNQALEKGGAIYVHSPGPSRLAFKTTKLMIGRCFLRYEDPNVDHNDWNTTLHFINNTAPQSCGNSLFANTLQTCRFPGEPRRGNTTLIWSIMRYSLSGNGSPEIATEAVEIVADIQEWHVSPSIPFAPRVTLLDERNNSVYGTIKVNISSHNANKVSLKNSVFLVKDKIPYVRILGNTRSKFNISFMTTAGQAVMTNTQSQSLSNCPPGFSYKDGICKCQSDKTGITRCDDFNVYILKGYWLGFDPNNPNSAILKPCPLHYCRDCSKEKKMNYECKYVAGNMCRPNRTGVLCSQCKRNTSVVLGSEECKECSNIYLLLIIPMVLAASLFVIVVMYFNFDFFSGYLNAYLYAYQTVNLMFVENVKLDPFIGMIIGITCLSGTGNTFGLCFYDGFNNLQKLGFNLGVPLYILLFLVTLCIVLPQRIWYKLFGVHSTRMNSFGRAFSFVYVYCYTSLTSKTLDLLHPIKIGERYFVFKAADVGYFGKNHLPYAISALVILVIFVIGFPILLLFTPFFTERFPKISRMDPAFNALKNCFKSPYSGKDHPNYRHFAAFYFVCRFILLLFATFMEEETSKLVIIAIACVLFQVIFTWCQPYILQSFNFWDTLILTNLCIISLINIILSVPYVLPQGYQQLSVNVLQVAVYCPLVTVVLRLMAYFYRRRKIKMKRQMDYEGRGSGGFFFILLLPLIY